MRRRIRLGKVFWSAFSHLPQKQLRQRDLAPRCPLLPVRSMSAFMLESISVKISWKWSLTAARTALCAKKERPLVRRVMSQNRPASRWLLSLLSMSELCDITVFVTHPLPPGSYEAQTKTIKTDRNTLLWEYVVCCVCEKALPGDKRESKWEWVRRCELKCVRCRKRRLSP